MMLLAVAAAAIIMSPPIGVVNPNVTQANIHSTICVKNWTATIRPPASYTTKLKIKQLAGRGDPKLYEEDHLISLELGGHPTDPNNLWPELWSGPTGARVKDQLENRLHNLVCSKINPLPLATAQKAIATDWKAAYKKYMPVKK